jgi:hypothetical protein
VIFLLLYASGKLPGLFALPAGAGDVAVGLLAPVVASTAGGDQQTDARRVWLWTLLGIADLIVALGSGFLPSPAALQVFVFDPPQRTRERVSAGLDLDFPGATIDPATPHVPDEA